MQRVPSSHLRMRKIYRTACAPYLQVFFFVKGDRVSINEHRPAIIMVLMSSYPHDCQQGCSDQTTRGIGDKIRPSGLPAGERYLMPFIGRSYHQSSKECDDKPAPAVQSTAHTNCPRKQDENDTVGQLIPWFGYQVDSNRLGASHKQAENDPRCKQHGSGT